MPCNVLSLPFARCSRPHFCSTPPSHHPFPSDTSAFMWGNEADRKHRLEEILQREDNLDSDKDLDPAESEDQAKIESQQMDEDLAAAQATAEGFCVECKDQESFYSCEQCAEDFCEVCFGKRMDSFRHKSFNDDT